MCFREFVIRLVCFIYSMMIVYVNVCVQTFIYPGCYIYVYHTFDCELNFLRFNVYVYALPTETKNEGRTSQSPYLRVRDNALTFHYVSRRYIVLISTCMSKSYHRLCISLISECRSKYLCCVD